MSVYDNKVACEEKKIIRLGWGEIMKRFLSWNQTSIAKILFVFSAFQDFNSDFYPGFYYTSVMTLISELNRKSW